MRTRPLALLVLAVLLLAGCTQTPPPTDGTVPGGDEADPAEISAVATGLDTVWEVAFSPDDRVFLTERKGTIQVLDGIGDDAPTVWKQLDGTVERGESGLMGLALHPSFPEAPWVYVCQTHSGEDGGPENRVLRVREEEGSGGEVEVLLDGIDASSVHDGCRLGFGPEEHLYVTMGDAARSSQAQDPDSPNGKVLRMTDTGEPAGVSDDGHPYIYTLGHRNPQGLGFHPETGVAYVSEHGPENHDEVNVLRSGDNYGWPEVRGTDDGGGRFHPAIWSSGEGSTVAPAGAAFVDAPGSPLDGAFVVGTLKAAQLHVFELDEDDATTVADEHVVLDGSFGRLRAVTWGPDDALYLGTSNADGRGTPGPQDDRILRVPLSVLEDRVESG